MLGCVLEQVNRGDNPHITEKLLTWTLNHNSNKQKKINKALLVLTKTFNLKIALLSL